MRNLSGACSFLLLSATALAQAPATTSTVVIAPPASQNCPVGLEARHAQEGAMVNVAPLEKHPGQGFRLTFVPGIHPAIAQARITLHGIAGGHVLPAGDRAAGETTESFNVNPAAAEHHRFHSTVYTEKLTGVQWVELNEVTYADGTRWHEAPDATCRVAPNGYMLVAGR